MDKKTTYYFKARAYTKKGSTKIYGAWSKTKKVKVKNNKLLGKYKIRLKTIFTCKIS